MLLIGGPPGIGKTSLAGELLRSLSRAALLDADDVWRIQPFEVTDETKALVEHNVTGVLRGYLDAAYPLVVLVWVLHRQDLIERLLASLDVPRQDCVVLHLVATPDILRRRLEADGRESMVGVALERLRQIEALPYFRIDTTALEPSAVVEAITSRLESAR